ncbi:MAG TPA: ABC transporter ATP-binding protein [Hyphomicrobium sp.]|nr:ABC transporter ATP-binding protein [Hyphomicrobium sp.]
MSLVCERADVRLADRDVLTAFDFTVKPGEVVAVVGANGAGKSTALRLMAGLLQAERGSVLLDGVALSGYGRHALGQKLAYLPQDRTVHWGLAVERVVALGRLPHKSVASGIGETGKRAVSDAMARMDVAHLAQRSVARLSGGERARVLFARALAQEATYLLADEPTAGLDPAHALLLFEELQRLSQEGKAVVTALHDLSLAARYATRVVMFKAGHCIADGPPAQVLSSAHLADAFGIDAIVSHIDGYPVFLPRSALRKPIALT